MTGKIISTFGIKIIIAAINLAIVILLSQETGAVGKGEASVIITSIAFINIICSFIGGPPLVYLVPRENLFQLIFISYAWSSIISSASYFVLISTNIISSEFAVHIAILSFLNAIISTNLTILLGKEKILTRNLLALLQSSLTIFILVMFFYYFKEKSVASYISSLYNTFTAIAIISLILLLPEIKTTKFVGLSPLILKASRYGFYNQLGHIMQFLSLRISYYVLLKYAGESSVGVYSNGVSLAESIWLISNSMAMVQYARIANNENKKENQLLTLKLIKASTVFCILGIIPLIALPPAFYEWLFGNDFSSVKTVIFILAPGIVVYNLELIVSHYFSGTGKYHINTIGNFLGLLVTIILTLLLIPQYGIMEAALIATLSYISTALFVTLRFFKESGFSARELIPSKSDANFIKIELQSMMKWLKF